MKQTRKAQHHSSEGTLLLVGVERLSAVVQDLFKQVGERHNISGLQTQILYLLHRRGESKVRLLANLFNLSPATVSASISKLEKAGLVEKPGKQRGRQGGRVVLTPTGKKVAADIAKRLTKVAESIQQISNTKELVMALQEIIGQLWRRGITQGIGTCFTCQWFKRKGEKLYCRYLQKALDTTSLRFDCPDHKPVETSIL